MFVQQLTARLAVHPKLKDIDATKLEVLGANFSSWAELAKYGAAGLTRDFDIPEALAEALIATAQSEAETESKTTVVAAVTGTMQVEESAAGNMFGKWNDKRGGQALYGITSQMLIGNWNPENIKLFAKAVAAFIADAGGLDTAVFEMVNRRSTASGSKITDPELRRLMFSYKRLKADDGVTFLKESERADYWKVVGKVLNDKDAELLAAAASLFNRREEAMTLGSQASITVGNSQFAIRDIMSGLARMAAKIDGIVARGDFAEASELMAEGEYEPYVWKLLLNTTFQRMAGVIEVNEQNPAATAFEALANEGFSEAGNYMLAALSVQELFARLALCPAEPDLQYAMFIGESASNWLSTARGLNLEGSREVAKSADVAPFSAPAAPREPRESRQTTKRWSISFLFAITRG